MQRIMLKGKLHQARVTHAELEYEGSCAIDQDLLDAAGILAFEKIEIYNIDNGERFSTYAISGERGSKMISVNGAAAHKASPGHRVIICAYMTMNEADAKVHQPSLVYCDANNSIKGTGNGIPTQAA
ncbi:aspartate 1-decarboxylase [Ferrimonas lipolytica]|uniref:Aspartate 1-decarboxylase n=1 Tax=Ferrimonas lipolytica TaxID=2724191 RepID=A0A6H1UF06_9GAMM|nr:aspartate 1-decarboxylase [Ferrimonas lipolytica]QIZ77687.1 aspartate 1-decarboxylase [Ferrimonas lipolytica]